MGNNSSSSFDFSGVWKGHGSKINSFLIFEDPERLITASDDRTIRMWDLENMKCLCVIKKHSLGVFGLMQFNKNTILSCSDDTLISAYAVLRKEPYYEFKKEFTQHSSPVFHLMKFSDHSDLFLSTSRTNEFLVISYEQNQLVKKLKTEDIQGELPVILSKSHPNCFYAITEDQNVRLVDFEKDESVKEYKKHNFLRKSKLLTICTYLNEKRNEMLVCGGEPFHNMTSIRVGLIYVYDTSIEDSQKGLIKNVNVKNSIGSLFATQDYICAGASQTGSFYLFDVNNEFEEKVEKEIHDEYITCLYFTKKVEEVLTLEVYSSSSDKLVKKMEIKGLEKIK